MGRQRIGSAVLVGVLLLWGGCATAAFGIREQPGDPVRSARVTRGDVVILDGEELVPGVTVEVRGSIGIFGNAPFTYPAIRTQVGVAEPQPWLLELTGMDSAAIESVTGRPVVVTGTLTELPRGPSPGRLEVSGVTEAP